MKRIGIVTIIGDFNYGNRLQNYALAKTLSDMGFVVKTLNFRYTNRSTISVTKEILRNFVIALGIGRFKRNKKFKKFNKYIKFTPIIYNNDVINSNEYDYFVCGSDQIWNYNFDEFGKNTLLLFSSKEKNIAYAASFGVSSIPNNYIDIYKEGLNNFKNISLRENDGKDIIKNITNKEYPVVLDPTFLISKNEWNKLAKEVKISKKYILVYILGDKNEDINKKYKKEYDVIYMNDTSNFNIYSTGPQEFLWLIKNAELVITDSYHACVFSIIFEKKFYVIDRLVNKEKCMEGRINTILSLLNLQDRKIENIFADTNINSNIDYNNVKKILETEIFKSKKFLKDNIK